MIRSPAGSRVLWTWARSVLWLIPLGHLVLLRPYNKPSSIFSAAGLHAHPMAADLPGPPALTQPFLDPCCPPEPGVPRRYRETKEISAVSWIRSSSGFCKAQRREKPFY